MNIAITGHTKGIGKYLYDNFVTDNNVLGFSFSTGYDIGSELDRIRIIEQVKNYDVFINCAYNYKKWDNSQLELLKLIFNTWKNDSKKHIINFSSAAGDLHPFIGTIKELPNYHKYVEAKWEQDQWFLQNRDTLSFTKRVKITNIRPSIVLVEKFEKKWSLKNAMSCKEIFDIIQFILENKTIEFNNITIKRFND